MRSIDESLQRLQTDYVDVLLAHDIEFGRPEQVLEETVDALERCKQEGKCRWIGMSGYPLNVLRRAVETRHLDVVLSYCHYCLYNTQLTEDLLPAAMANGVTVLNASPLGMGLLSGSPPPPWHPAAAGLRQACERAAAYCKERGVELATVAMQFAVGAPDVACTIAGMATRELVEWNVAATATPPEPDLIEAVRAILKPVISAEWPSGRGLW